MNAEIFGEWLRRQRHQVLRTASTFWFDPGFRIYQAFPYHWLICPSQQELIRLFSRKGAIALRYSTARENGFGCPSYHVVYEGSAYTLDILERRTRQNVRTGLSRCRVAQIPMSQLAEEGWLLEADTLKRQGRHGTITMEAWRRRCLAAEDLSGFEAWGAFAGDRLVASLLTVRIDDCCEMIAQQCHHEFLSARVNNALAFTVTQTMMSRPEIRSIFYALQSLNAPASVDEFKFRMGYTAKPVHQRVVFHPWLKPFANRAAHSIVMRLARWRPGSRTFGKAEGMLRFYLEERSLLSGKALTGGAEKTVSFSPDLVSPRISKDPSAPPEFVRR